MLNSGAWGTASQPCGREGFWKAQDWGSESVPKVGESAWFQNLSLSLLTPGWGEQANDHGGSGSPSPAKVLNKDLESAVSK